MVEFHCGTMPLGVLPHFKPTQMLGKSGRVPDLAQIDSPDSGKKPPEKPNRRTFRLLLYFCAASLHHGILFIPDGSTLF